MDEATWEMLEVEARQETLDEMQQAMQEMYEGTWMREEAA